jgi:hypothetical protein
MIFSSRRLNAAEVGCLGRVRALALAAMASASTPAPSHAPAAPPLVARPPAAPVAAPPLPHAADPPPDVTGLKALTPHELRLLEGMPPDLAARLLRTLAAIDRGPTTLALQSLQTRRSSVPPV